MKKTVKLIFMLILLILIIVYAFSLVKCEVITRLHGEEFKNMCYTMYDFPVEYDEMKIIEYEAEKCAVVYYITGGYSAGVVDTFEYVDGTWQIVKWNTAWSDYGSADKTVYPYLWHWFYFMPMNSK